MSNVESEKLLVLDSLALPKCQTFWGLRDIWNSYCSYYPTNCLVNIALSIHLIDTTFCLAVCFEHFWLKRFT